MIKPMTIS